jgi:predicted GNAT family acetyltransferase
MATPFANNTNESRFEYATNGLVAFADYRRQGSTLYIDFVFSPPELRGTGAAGKLMQEIMNFAKAENLTVVPICGYAAAWMAKNRKQQSGPGF